MLPVDADTSLAFGCDSGSRSKDIERADLAGAGCDRDGSGRRVEVELECTWSAERGRVASAGSPPFAEEMRFSLSPGGDAELERGEDVHVVEGLALLLSSWRILRCSNAARVCDMTRACGGSEEHE